ncbi:hypothetical protein RhiirB3_411551 [Rhizophagus irregularis]|nr:hypothetical protein RhiirB3_411551 [Rhizophagus irregularis]
MSSSYPNKSLSPSSKRESCPTYIQMELGNYVISRTYEHTKIKNDTKIDAINYVRSEDAEKIDDIKI